MSDTSRDALQLKTNDELLFLAQNPGYYHADLVAAARQELRSRGVALPSAAPSSAAAGAPASVPAGNRQGTLWALLVAGAVVLSVLGWFTSRSSADDEQAEAAPAAAAAPARPKTPPRLVDVPTAALPTYEGVVARCIDQQLKRVPAAEQTDAQALRQYRELTKRFWAAQTLTEYITAQARAGKTTAVFGDQVGLVQSSWQQLNKAMVYSYKFGPTMANHLDLMSRVSRQQQEGLSDLPAQVAAQQPVEDESTQRRDADVQDLLSGLLPASPVSGQPYKAQVRRVRL